jgi:hypothetical protein
MLRPHRLKVGALVLNALDDPFKGRNGLNGLGDLVAGRVERVLFLERERAGASLLLEGVQDEKAAIRKTLLKTISQLGPHMPPAGPPLGQLRILVEPLPQRRPLLGRRLVFEKKRIVSVVHRPV